MTVPTIDLLLRKLSQRDQLEPFEEDVLRGLPAIERAVAPRELLVREGQPLEHSLLLIEGFVCRYHDLADGARVILEIHVPGDFLDLQAFLLKRLEHNVRAISAARVAHVPHDRLREVTERWPHLTRLLWFTTLAEAAIHRQWIVSNARRSALARLAHLFCELRQRLEVTGLADRAGYALPLTQTDLADATGLTAIHVNRMLKVLRDDGMMTFRDGRVVIDDLARLERIAEFDPSYLFLERRPR